MEAKLETVALHRVTLNGTVVLETENKSEAEHITSIFGNGVPFEVIEGVCKTLRLHERQDIEKQLVVKQPKVKPEQTLELQIKWTRHLARKHILEDTTDNKYWKAIAEMSDEQIAQLLENYHGNTTTGVGSFWTRKIKELQDEEKVQEVLNGKG